MGRTSRYSYDANRRLTSVIDPLNRTTSYDYYPNGTLKTLTDAKGNITTWERDIQSRVTRKIYADGTGTTYTYEPSTSRLKSITDALGQTKNLTYTLDNRLANRSYSNAINPTPSVTYSWDAYFPRPVSMTDGNGITNFQYKPLGSAGALALAAEDGPYNNDTVAYSYDALGRVIGRTVDNAADTQVFDTLSRLTGRNSPLGTINYSYLGQTDQPTSLTMTGTPIKTRWTYENNTADRRLKTIQNAGSSRSFAYFTRPENIIDRMIEGVGTPQKGLSFKYDDADRLIQTKATTGEEYCYAYDEADNMYGIKYPTGKKLFTHTNTNQIADTPYHYDLNGNLLEDDLRSYQWDAQNRLLSIGYKSAPARKTTFRYDGNDRRTAIIEDTGTSTSETRYTWCGDTICQARNAGDEVTRRYYAEGEVWPQYNARLFYSTDHLGSVRDVLAAPSGSKVSSYDYDAYGNATAATGKNVVDFHYAGMFYHQGSGLYLTQYRAYDPRTARWLSRDPIEENGGLNLYGYVGGNPTSYNDPTGLYAETALDVGFIGYDIYALATDSCNRTENWIALGLEAVWKFSSK